MHDRLRSAILRAAPRFFSSFSSFSSTSIAWMTVIGLLLGAGSAWAAHEHDDSFEVAGPALASPTQFRLDALTEDPATGRSRAPRRFENLRSSAARFGLEDAELPPRRAASLRLPADREALADPVAASLSAVEAHPALFGVGSAQMRLSTVKETPRMTYVRFRQEAAGHPVLQSRVSFNWDRQGRLALTGAEVYLDDPLRPDAAPGSGGARAPGRWLDVTQARAGALSGMPADLEVIEWEHEERAWLPLADDVSGHRLVSVWNLRYRTDEPPGWWDTVVDGETGQLVSRVNRIHWERLDGTIRAGVEAAMPGDPQELLPLKDVFVQVTHPTQGPSVIATDAQGAYEIDLEDGVDHDVASALFGRWIRIENRLAGSVTPTQELETRGGTVDLLWDGTNSAESDRDAYYHGTLVHDYVRALDPGPVMSPLDAPMMTVVDDPTGVCNAYWNGFRMNFYAAGGGCAATARIADVVYHEYGHAVTQWAYWPDFGPSDIHEGMSDYIAATITDQPFIGRGFFGPGTDLRDIETDLVWPDDRESDPHTTGLILAGAFWDLRKVLGPELTDELAQFPRYAAPADFDDYLLEVLVYDDDDGDLINGSPHWREIVTAFEAHGIGDYTVYILAPQLPDIEVADSSIDVTLIIQSLLGLDSDELALFYRHEGDEQFTRTPLVSTVAAREFQVSIPVPEPETRVYYYWTAADTSGNRSFLPPDAPAETFSFYYGVDVIPPRIEHDPIDVVTPAFENVTVRAEASDNSQRLGSFRAVFRDGGGAESEVDMSARPNGDGFESVLDFGPSVPGEDLLYRFVATDEAQTINTGTLPPDGDFVISVRDGEGSDFEAGDEGMIGAGDWAWGEVQDPEFVYSGSHAWATQLEGNYSDGRFSPLVWGSFDLTRFDRARLQFRHRYDIELAYDGGNVQISTNGGGSWTILQPDGGYPTTTVGSLDQPGYSGQSDGWKLAVFSLDRFLDQTSVTIRFQFASDAYVSGRGWYIDDLMLVAAQARMDPLGFEATDAMDERVELSWRRPAGIDPDSGRFLGFNLYRGVGEEPEEMIRLNEAPLTGFSYIDDGLQNDQPYLYRLTALYDEGESRGVYDVGMPVSASLGLDVTQFNINVNDYETHEEQMTIRNVGPGFLRYQLYVADVEQELEDIRIDYDLPPHPTTEYETVFEDPEDSPDVIDFRSLDVRRRVRDDGKGLVEFRLTGHGPWGNPLTEWGGVLLLDTDGDLEPAQAVELGWNEGLNIGYDYGILFGVLPGQAGLGEVAAVLFDPSLQVEPVPLNDFAFPVDADSLTIGVPLSLIGNPSALQIEAVAARSLGLPALDYLPQQPPIRWLDRTPRAGDATSEGASRVHVKIDATGLLNGRHDAKLILLSNDDLNPFLDIPVTLFVDRALPGNLASLSFESSLAGMEMAFRFRPEVLADSVAVERQVADEEDWQPIGPTRWVPGEDGVYRHLDRGLVPGTEYWYNIFVRSADGRTHVYGPNSTDFEPVIPEIAEVAFASELTGIYLEFQSAEGAFAHVWRGPAEGELVRITEEPLLPGEEGRFAFLDTDVEANQAYDYQFEVYFSEDVSTQYGPYRAEFDRAQPDLVDLDIASAEEGVRVAFLVPETLEQARRVWIERSPAGENAWIELTEEGLLPGEEGGIEVFDRWGRDEPAGLVKDGAYDYRIRISLEEGPPLVYGPYEITFTPPLPAEVRLHAGRPNPFRADVLLRLDLPVATGVKLEIFDAAGRRRATVVDRTLGPGIERVLWDGRDDLGESLPSGVYWVRLRTESTSKTVRLVRTK